MHELIVPTEVKISEIIKKGSLSPNNYKKLEIKNPRQNEIRYYLNPNNPFVKGIEPGSSAYVNESDQVFLRNSCINDIRFSHEKEKYIYLNPKYYDDSMVENEDILFCTDANIGECGLFIGDGEKVIFSSGMIKLNFVDERTKYYVMGLMRDDYFKEQLKALTPKGSTIKHSGDLFLNCLIPDCPYEWIYSMMEHLIKNIAYTEHICNSKLRDTENIINDELMVTEYDYENPSIVQLQQKIRLDSGIYSNQVFQWRKNVENYKHGFSNLAGFGFKTQRGPSLQKRDLGRSIQTEHYRKGYNLLIYPSDISSSGYIENVTYLGARNRVWFLGEKYILFSSEGTIGKTFVVCDDSMNFTTNIHGTMIYPLDMKTDISKSIFLGLYLNYLRNNGVLNKMSVGANGGSFAVGYWDNIIIPNVSDDFMKSLALIYNNTANLKPTVFSLDAIKTAGIYQLNNFLIKCKAMLDILCGDIKTNSVHTEDYYNNYII